MHNKCHALETFWNHPCHSHLWKNCLEEMKRIPGAKKAGNCCCCGFGPDSLESEFCCECRHPGRVAGAPSWPSHVRPGLLTQCPHRGDSLCHPWSCSLVIVRCYFPPETCGSWISAAWASPLLLRNWPACVINQLVLMSRRKKQAWTLPLAPCPHIHTDTLVTHIHPEQGREVTSPLSQPSHPHSWELVQLKPQFHEGKTFIQVWSCSTSAVWLWLLKQRWGRT